ncbi:hypothetical protein KZZ07_15815 [Mameliella sp. CS4]|uniref:hypothetical protein n=1 Tax=Mameliella sp. CS4 TaxID=2862329 RepID=UPI001C5E4B5F|nr:hypothetical protein [Mameliella sp. CS4]MBW4984010.1 hypothetical protein [Mameliella sp. CS4]
MNITETIGMISTGALIALGAVYLLDGGDSPQPGPQPAAVYQPSAPATPARTPDPAPETVTRTKSADLVGLGGADRAERLQRIVALSQQSLSRTVSLTPEQEEAIAFFERLARQHNQSDRTGNDGVLRFSNMAVDSLTVKYFFRLDAPYMALTAPELDEALQQHVSGMLCGSEAVRKLMTDYGFSYEYFYTGSDDRLVKRLAANAGFCV